MSWRSRREGVLGWQKGLAVQSTGIILGNTGCTRIWKGRLQDDAADFPSPVFSHKACNIILEEIKAYEDVTEEEDVQNVNRIKGESYFLRGSCYFFLVNLYGRPYAKATAGNDPAVPDQVVE